MSAMVPYRASSAKGKKRGRSKSRSKVLTVADVKRIAMSTQETKNNFTEVDVANVFLPDFYLMNGIPYGTLPDNDRIAGKITSMSIELRGAVSAGANTTKDVSFALMLILDKEPDGNAPTTGQIWEVNNSSYGTDPLFALRRPEYAERFKILWREDHTVGPRGNGGVPSQITFHKYIDLTKLKFSERVVQYVANVTTPSGMGSNALYFAVIPSNQTNFGEALAADSPVYYAQTKYGYKDA